jgi:SAM-dependent methyltransferase
LAKRDAWKREFDDRLGDHIFLPLITQTPQEVTRLVRQTKLSKNARLLDVASGRGRHSLELARRGYEVCGLEYSKIYYREAKRQAAREGLGKATFIQGDMRKLSTYFAPESFEGVFLLFHSFGYFEDRNDDFTVLQEIARVLKPGGCLVLDTLNFRAVERHWLAMQQIPRLNGFHSVEEPRPGIFELSASHIEWDTRRLWLRWIFIETHAKSSRIRRYEIPSNLYSDSELKGKLQEVGLVAESPWRTNLGGEIFRRDDTVLQTFLARKTNVN